MQLKRADVVTGAMALLDDEGLDGLTMRKLGARLGQASGELSPYWRWVLTTFGPDMLDAFGSFDFLATDLIPVTLIRESLGDRRRRSARASDDLPF